MDDEVNDAPSNPLSDEHLPVAGEISVGDQQIPTDYLEDE